MGGKGVRREGREGSEEGREVGGKGEKGARREGNEEGREKRE